jgi:hypothetical protein
VLQQPLPFPPWDDVALLPDGIPLFDCRLCGFLRRVPGLHNNLSTFASICQAGGLTEYNDCVVAGALGENSLIPADASRQAIC